MTVTQAQVDEAVNLLLKHVRHARSNGFIGDSRERSADIRRSVHRLDDPELARQYSIMQALARVTGTGSPLTIPRYRRVDLYDVTHEIRSEYFDRQQKG